MTRSLLPPLALGLALVLSACSGSDGPDGPDDDPTAAATPDESSSDASSSAPTTPTDDPTSAAPSYPAFAPETYTYRLQVTCFCPQVGAVRIRVEDGKVATATALTGRLKGKPAPAFTRLSINDIIDRANDPSADKVKVVWPSGQEHPTSVRIDRLARATDDEVTYVIRKVRVDEDAGNGGGSRR